MIRLLVDSASDYRPEELAGRNIEYVSMSITLGEETYRDGVDIDKDGIYKRMQEEDVFPKTALPSPATFVDIFEDAKEKGDEVICILVSAHLSGTYQSAVLAKEMVEYDKIHIIDSNTVTYCIKLLVEYAEKLREQCVSAEEIVKEVEELKSRTCVLAALDTLEYLQKGGRLSKTSATIGSLVNIKPIVTISEEGTVSIAKKCVGKVKARSALISLMKEQKVDSTFPIYPVYTYGTSNCDKMMEVLAKDEVELDEKLQIGATIGSHVGPECYGVVFIKEK